MPGLEEIDPDAYSNRIMRTGGVDSWNVPAFVRAVEAIARSSARAITSRSK